MTVIDHARAAVIAKAAKKSAECIIAVRSGHTDVGMRPDGRPEPYVAMREDGSDHSHAVTIVDELGATWLLMLAEERELQRLTRLALIEMGHEPDPTQPQPEAQQAPVGVSTPPVKDASPEVSFAPPPDPAAPEKPKLGIIGWLVRLFRGA